MRTPRLLCALLLASLLLPALAFAQTSEQEAGDVSELERDKGPLRERIAPVSGHLFLKAGRFELSPSASVSLRDAFFNKYIFGGTLTYHVSEALAFDLRGGYAINTVSGGAQICNADATLGPVGCHPPSFSQLDGRAPGQLSLLGGLDVQWAPLYGKISLLAERFLHFDIYGVGGAALVQYRGPTTSGTGKILTFGGNVGAGTHIFINRWITVRAELRDLIYVEDVQPLPASSLRNQLLFELGISFFFPMTFGES